MTVLLLLAIALPFSAGTAFAATNVTNGTSSQTNTTTSNNLAKVTDQNSTPTTNSTETTKIVNTTVINTQAKTVTPTTTKANSSSTNEAAGSAASTSTVKTETSTSFTNAEITSAAAQVQSFVQINDRLPNYVTISNTEVTMPEFLQLLVNDLLNYNSGLNTPVTLKTVQTTTNPTENLKTGNILKSEYLTLAKSIEASIASTGKAPSYVNSPLGTINFENLVYSFSKIMNFQGTNHRLPNYVSVEPWSQVIKNTATSEGSSSSIPAALLPYLQPTTNAQSNNPTIIALANKITKGLTTPYAKAVAIFDWVRDNITYSFYYNTKYGALGTLAAGTGNCCDHSNLVVALARAAGIPARYQQGYCDFSDGWYGHVWAQLYVNGQWYYADTISTANTFGTIHNWNLNTYTLEGTFITLPF